MHSCTLPVTNPTLSRSQLPELEQSSTFRCTWMPAASDRFLIRFPSCQMQRHSSQPSIQEHMPQNTSFYPGPSPIVWSLYLKYLEDVEHKQTHSGFTLFQLWQTVEDDFDPPLHVPVDFFCHFSCCLELSNVYQSHFSIASFDKSIFTAAAAHIFFQCFSKFCSLLVPLEYAYAQVQQERLPRHKTSETVTFKN